MGKGRKAVGVLVRRMGRGHEKDLSQSELARGRLGGPQVPAMDRIEGSAEQRNVHVSVGPTIRDAAWRMKA